MELFLFKHSEYERLYNCSKIQIDQIPLNQRQHPLAASILICLCAIYYVRFSIDYKTFFCFRYCTFLASSQLPVRCAQSPATKSSFSWQLPTFVFCGLLALAMASYHWKVLSSVHTQPSYIWLEIWQFVSRAEKL